MLNTLRALYLSIILLVTQTFGLTASEIGVTSFLLPSILMGFGIGLDVFLATIAQFRDRSLTWHSWTLPVTLTHTFFPAVGYFLFWYAGQGAAALQMLLGIFGFLLVVAFVYEVLCDLTDSTPIFGISDALGKLIGINEEDSRRFIAVLAVSWDALWSGPAKAAQASAGAWNNAEVVFSFFVAGIVVILMAEIALLTAHLLRHFKFKSAASLSRFNIFGTYLELSVIGGFGVLSLWYAFSTTANLYNATLITAVIILFLFLVFRESLWRTQIEESKEVLTN